MRTRQAHTLTALAAALRVILLLSVITAPAAFAAIPVQVATGSVNTGTSVTATFTNPVTAGDRIVIVLADNNSSAITSVSDSASDAIVNRVAYAGTGTAPFMLVDEVSSTAGGSSFSVTVNFGNRAAGLIIAEYAPANAGTFDQATVVASGTSISPASASLTPAQSGELAIGVILSYSGSITLSSWSNGFTQETAETTWTHFYLADQTLSTTASVTAAGTLSSSATWLAAELLYKPTAGGACTHAGFTTAGATAVPNGASGSYILANGTIGTPDCSTIKYCNTSGTCGVN